MPNGTEFVGTGGSFSRFLPFPASPLVPSMKERGIGPSSGAVGGQ